MNKRSLLVFATTMCAVAGVGVGPQTFAENIVEEILKGLCSNYRADGTLLPDGMIRGYYVEEKYPLPRTEAEIQEAINAKREQLSESTIYSGASVKLEDDLNAVPALVRYESLNTERDKKSFVAYLQNAWVRVSKQWLTQENSMDYPLLPQGSKLPGGVRLEDNKHYETLWNGETMKQYSPEGAWVQIDAEKFGNPPIEDFGESWLANEEFTSAKPSFEVVPDSPDATHGQVCLRRDITTPDGKHQLFEAVLDSSRKYMPVSFYAETETDYWHVSYEDYRQVDVKGVPRWLPFKTVKTSGVRSGGEAVKVGERLTRRVTIVLEEVNFSERVDDSVFSLSFPKGTLVMDTIRRINYKEGDAIDKN